ncbi:hypothetical protein GCM10010431_18670 [Streptomyces kunmingensis]
MAPNQFTPSVCADPPAEVTKPQRRAPPLPEPRARARPARARRGAGPSSPAARALLERLRAALVPNAAP